MRHHQVAQVAGIGAGPADGRERRAQLPAGTIEDVGCIPEQPCSSMTASFTLPFARCNASRASSRLCPMSRVILAREYSNCKFAIFNATCARSFR